MGSDYVQSNVRSAVVPGTSASLVFASDSAYVEIVDWIPDTSRPGVAVVLACPGLPRHPLVIGSLFAGRPKGSEDKSHSLGALPGPIADFAGAASQLNGVISASNQTVADLLVSADHRRLLNLASTSGAFEARFMPGSMTFLKAFDDLQEEPAPDVREALRDIVALIVESFRSTPHLRADDERSAAAAVHEATELRSALAIANPPTG